MSSPALGLISMPADAAGRAAELQAGRGLRARPARYAPGRGRGVHDRRAAAPAAGPESQVQRCLQRCLHSDVPVTVAACPGRAVCSGPPQQTVLTAAMPSDVAVHDVVVPLPLCRVKVEHSITMLVPPFDPAAVFAPSYAAEGHAPEAAMDPVGYGISALTAVAVRPVCIRVRCDVTRLRSAVLGASSCPLWHVTCASNSSASIPIPELFSGTVYCRT